MSIIKQSKRTIRQQCESCGSKDLYWGKQDGNWVLIDANESTRGIPYKGRVPERHLHAHQPKHQEAQAEPTPEPTPEPVKPEPEVEAAMSEVPDPYWEPSIARGGSKRKREPKPEPVEVSENGDLTEALELLRKIIGKPAIDREQVEAIAREVIGEVVFPTKTVIVNPKGKPVREITGNTHSQLADVIRALQSRHVFLVGPAGTGKSTIAEHAAEALGLSFANISLTQQTPEIALRGYTDANGHYHRTAFLDAFEHGGVYCVDEIDHGHPNTVGVMNAALSNGAMYFPGYGMVKRHPDFRCVATANTFGRGASREYVGATQLDAASIDRFAFLTIDVDDALESAMVAATGVDDATQRKVLTYVRKLRANREKTGARVVVSPRASVGIAVFLRDGFTFDAAVDANIRKGTSDDVWSKLVAN